LLIQDFVVDNLTPAVTMRLAPVMPTTVARANFPNVKRATEAVIEILNQGVGIRT
jgi:D-lactate dehydrogenase (cytochrome)